MVKAISLLNSIVTIALLSSCGGASPGEIQQDLVKSGVKLEDVASFLAARNEAALPLCDDSIDLSVYLLVDEGKFRVCDSGEWKTQVLDPMNKLLLRRAETSNELPSCDEDSQNVTYLIANESKFAECKSGGWAFVSFVTSIPKDPSPVKRSIVCDVKSEDLDPHASYVSWGKVVHAIEFWDGSYYISCQSEQVDAVLSYFDVATGNMFVSADKAIKDNFVLRCPAPYAIAVLNVKDNTVYYEGIGIVDGKLAKTQVRSSTYTCVPDPP